MNRPGVRMSWTYAFLILGLVIILTVPSTARSQFVPCEIVNVSITHPNSVPEGQTLQVTTSLTASCDPSVFYVLRVDLVEQPSGTVLSSVKLPYYPTVSSFTRPINNTATAPMSIGPWVLQSQVYIINGLNGQTAGSSQQQFVVDITQYNPQTTTSVFSAANTTQVSLSSTFSTQTALSSATSTISLIPTFATNETTAQPENSVIEALVVILLVGAATFFLIMWRRRPPTPQPGP